ncbi:MAG: hypothetical protein HC882_06060 [Acidobacteria bacterium]|nr:hypothetical protein [Acidobacteriota bacterium]
MGQHLPELLGCPADSRARAHRLGRCDGSGLRQPGQPGPGRGQPAAHRGPYAPSDGFFENVSYRGAFGPRENENWALGWSTLSRLGYFPPTVVVDANITESQTWYSDFTYELSGVIYVENGATLTIQPGTIVRGQPAPAGTTTPGTLVIARGAKLVANGTQNAPIIFTDLNDDNIGDNPGTAPYDTLENALALTGQWGGVILLGRTYVAFNTSGAADAARTNQIEGLTAAGGLGLYGGCSTFTPSIFPNCDDDDSGSLQYVSIRYAGFNVSANNEINGLTMGAVGRNTDLRYIEVLQNKDDAFEWFGGTVNAKNIIGAVGGDDTIDHDEGFRGKIQFAFVVQGTPAADKSDKMGELDGGNGPDASLPLALPTIYNVTAVGLGGQKAYSNALQNTALHFRDNTGGRWYNSAFLDFGGATLCIEGGSAAGTETGNNTSGQRAITDYVNDGAFYVEEDSQFQLELRNNLFWCFGNGQNPVTGFNTGAVNGCDGSKAHYDPGVFTNAAFANSYLGCTDALPIRFLERTDSGVATTPDFVSAIDPRPLPGGPLFSGVRTRRRTASSRKSATAVLSATRTGRPAGRLSLAWATSRPVIRVPRPRRPRAARATCASLRRASSRGNPRGMPTT